MKILVIFAIALMVVSYRVEGLVNSEEMPPDRDGAVPGEGGLESELQSMAESEEDDDNDEDVPDLQQLNAALQDIHGSNAQLQDIHGVELQAMDINDDAEMMDDDMYMQQSEPTNVPTSEKQDVEIEETSNGRILRCGSPTALRFLTKTQWLSCRTSTCKANTCPAQFFDSYEKSKCSREIFQFWQLGRNRRGYYLNKRGTYVRNGAYVGIWYPSTGHWLRAYRTAIFRIFARGKSFGAILRDQDTVVLYHVHTGFYVRFVSSRVYLSKYCLPRYRFPPLSSYVDRCGYNTVDIAVLGY